MGLSVLKWMYELGVRAERRRIAAFLQNVQNRRWDHVRGIEQSLDMSYRNNDRNNDEEAELKRQKSVDEAVNAIISQLFHGEEKYERGASVMFPEGEK